jgi:hypothetical protein
VEVKPYIPLNRKDKWPPGGEQATAQGQVQDRDRISCEVDYKSQAETVMVVADLKTTTVDLRLPGQPGGTVLVSSESKTQEIWD